MSRSRNASKDKHVAELLLIAAQQQESAWEAEELGVFGFEATYDGEESEWTVIHHSHG